MKSFLIIQTAFLGDVILATPVISELKRIYPNAKIDVLVRKEAEQLIKNHTDVNQVFVLNKNNGKLRSIRKVLTEVKKTNYDEVINLQRYFSSGLITVLSKAKRKIGFKKNPLSFLFNEKFEHKIGDGTHEVERNLSVIKHHGAESKIRPSLFLSEDEVEKTISYKGNKYYCLAPASVWKTKQLPKEKWVELAKALIKKGKVYFIGGPNDRELCNEINNEIDNIGLNLAGKLTLMESASLIKDAEMNYVNDSGPMHLASAMNAPTTAFFCSTVPSFGFGPLSDNSKIVETTSQLECRPCGLHGKKACPLKHFECGKTITIKC